MSLSFGTRSSNNGTSERMGPGVYVGHGTVQGVKVRYNAPAVEGWNPDDIVMDIQLDVDGIDFPIDILINGNWRKEPSGAGTTIVAGPGSAFKVLRVFDELGIAGEVSPQGRLPQEAIDQLYGHTLFYLRYVAYTKDDGSPGYRNWGLLAASWDDEEPADTRERLFDSFMQDDYMQEREYAPELLEQDAPAEQPVKDSPNGAASTPRTVTDDEVPF